MATPILRIPVDDAAFQKYIQAFQKYQAQLAEQPEMWQGTNKGISESAVAAGALAAAIAEQNEETRKLAAEEEKREKAANAAARQRKKEDDDIRKREEASAKRRKEAIAQVRDYARTAADLAINLGKYALGGGLIGGALSMFGLDKLVGSVADERRLSMGLGVSMAQQQGSAVNMQRYFDVNSTLSNMGNMQADPGSWGTFAMMGINPRGKNPNDLMMEAAEATRREYKRSGGDLVRMSQLGYTKAFGIEDIRRMGTETDDQWKTSRKAARNYVGLGDDVGRKWQNFMVAIDTAGLSIKNKLVDKLTLLEPDLERIIGKFGDLAVQVLDRIDFKRLGEGLDTFTKYIGSQQFQDDFKTFTTDVSLVANKLVSALQMLGVIPDPNYDAKMHKRFEDARTLNPDSPAAHMWNNMKNGFSSKYGPRIDPITGKPSFHHGLDIPMPVGTAIFAKTDGNVVFAGRKGGYGNYAKILDENGNGSAYGHLSSIRAKMGEHVWKGELIGFSGSTGRSTGPHLHYEAFRNGHDVDPMKSDVALAEAARALGSTKKAIAKSQSRPANIHVKIQNQTGASVATNVNAAAGG